MNHKKRAAADRERLDAFLRRCKRLRFCDDTLPTITDLLADADDKLFESILANSEHILHNYIPERARPSHHRHHLRPRKHSKELIPKTRKLNDKDFNVRMLYEGMY